MKIKNLLNKFKYLFLIALLLFNTVFLYTVSSQVSTIKENNTRIEKIADDFASLQDDVFLGEEVQLASQPTLSESLQIHLDKYYNQQELSNNQNEANQYFSSILELDIPEGFSLVQVSSTIYHINDNISTIAKIENNIDNNKLSIETLATSKTFTIYELEDFKSLVQSQTTLENLQNLNSKNQTYQQFLDTHSKLSSPENLQAINSKNLDLLSAYYSSGSAKADLTKEGQLMLTIYQDLDSKEFALKDFSGKVLLSSAQQDEFITKSIDYIKSNTFQTLFEQNINQKITLIKTELSSDQIKQTLSKNNLQVTEPNDTPAQWSISILNQAQESILTIRIDKKTSKVFLDSQNQETQLNFKDLNFKFDTSNQKSENFLILGKHGSLTDTIIIANFNSETKEAKLISIPRDLYVDNKKINSIYAYRGMDGLVSEIEQITGAKISKYALIDMYTFIDVVDYLGGIEVTLNKPLVDFNYKTYENGQWGTLNLQPGTHNLNGRQALRVARSRYTTSDFDRAYRQHLILNGIQKRVKELGAKDIKAISQIGLLGLQSTETDLSLTESLKYFKKYKDYTISETVVISPANVLRSTYTGFLNGQDPNTLTDAESKGAYILLPKNDDWSLIRTFIFNFLR